MENTCKNCEHGEACNVTYYETHCNLKDKSFPNAHSCEEHKKELIVNSK